MITILKQNPRDTAILFSQLEQRLATLMNVEKIYIQKNLSLDILSGMLHTNKNYLSQVINNRFHTNFNNYVNSYRVKEACTLLKQNNSEKHSVEYVGDCVGFSSRSTYFYCFKKFTGVSPVRFQKESAKITTHKISSKQTI